jgi:uncharacterized membrane protein YphA (DoxX/SURF4 family)
MASGLPGQGTRGRWRASDVVAWLALLGLCGAYLQGGLNKVMDFGGAIAEAEHFGLPFPVLAASATIVTELVGSAMILSGRLRWLGALWLAGFTICATLIAGRYWALPPGQARFMAANGFYEHLGLAGALLFVALVDLRQQDLRDARGS